MRLPVPSANAPIPREGLKVWTLRADKGRTVRLVLGIDDLDKARAAL
jgi:hypothetical protein